MLSRMHAGGKTMSWSIRWNAPGLIALKVKCAGHLWKPSDYGNRLPLCRYLMKLRLSIVQFARDKLNRDKNISRMTSLLREIESANIVCLPEMWIGAAILDENEAKSIISSVREIALRNNYCLLTGGLLIKREGKIFDTCHVIKENLEAKENRDRKEEFYDKRFPSAAIGEREYVSSGSTSGVFEVCGIKIGIAICVDAMYPEVIRELATGGALIVFNPSNIPDKRTELWKHISCARAAENTIFL